MNQVKKDTIQSSAFTIGSWVAFKLVDYNPPGPLSPGTIKSNMDVFNDKYKVAVKLVPSNELILWELSLEEKKGRRSRKSSGARSAKEETRIIKCKYGVSDDEGLLFKRSIPMDSEGHEIALYCSELMASV
ncbi:uncharacterized protein LOC121867626 [Homarus americanus]|uniref:Uncharacterized protein n=1 Tax=Homarus americanus TaxID=6706 RepID=A0A8J5K5T4_HOMAM|nr:uncharacterized protein LOC121867626 [Homarus americanus]KAG7168059.1 hypothetical protein Hamer_G026093 [Homarus americanus]